MHVNQFVTELKSKIENFHGHYLELNKVNPEQWPLFVEEDGFRDWMLLFIDYQVVGSLI